MPWKKISVGLIERGVDVSSWNKGSFSSATDSVARHYLKHGTEVGAESVEQYIRKAEGSEFARSYDVSYRWGSSRCNEICEERKVYRFSSRWDNYILWSQVEGEYVTEWKELKIEGIAYIEKCVAEFNIGEQVKTPWGKFKVKIYEKKDGKYIGFTNLLLKDETGYPYGGVGHGDTIEKALEDTIRYFLEMLNKKKDITSDDFESADPYDF